MIETAIQIIVARWNLDIELFKDFAPQDREYPFVTFKIFPAGMERTFCSDIPQYSVIFTVYTDSDSSSSAQTILQDIRTRYNRKSIDGLIECVISQESVRKDEGTHFYEGTSTYLIKLEISV